MSTVRDDPRYDAGGRAVTQSCLGCGRQFVPRGRQLYHDNACRQQAYRDRHQRPHTARGRAFTGRLTEHTQYECVDCGERYFGEQWCPDCQRPCRRVGIAFQCGCGETHLLADVLVEVGIELSDSALPTRTRRREPQASSRP